jgi:hypothetical protein
MQPHRSRLRRALDYVSTGAGLVVYYYFILRYPQTGAGYVHRAVHQPKRHPIKSKILRRYLDFEAHKIPLLQDYAFAKQEQHADRPSERAIASYGNDSLCGYGDLVYTNGGEDIPDQQRGVILPLLERVIAETSGALCELGNGNGDVVAYLSQRHPDRRFIGVDFSVKNANTKWGTLPNVEFRAGYPADVLSAMKPDEAKTLYASFTMLCLTPPEMAKYARLIASKGFDDIVFCEPHWHGWSADMLDGEQKSVHLEQIAFFHNYARHFAPHGYQVAHFEERPWKHPRSPRPDIVLTLIWLRRVGDDNNALPTDAARRRVVAPTAATAAV